MSTAATPSDLPAPRPLAATAPGLGRLTAVELRKMVDTRAGAWLLGITAALTLAVAVIAVFAFPDEDARLLDFFAIATLPSTLLLPVIGILLVTSEWSQRTAMVTFTLVPRRLRIFAAKLLAGLALSGAAFVLSLVAGVAMTAAAAGDWSFSFALGVQGAVSVVVPMLAGIGFGAVLLASAPAIVLYYVLPAAWSALGSIPAVESVAEWLDQARTMTPLLEETLSSGQWARVATSLALWLALPLAVGCWRIAKADVR